MNNKLLLLIVSFFLSTSSTAIEVYKWVDKEGIVSFSQTPPPSEHTPQNAAVETLSFADPPLIEEMENPNEAADKNTLGVQKTEPSKRLPPVKIYTTSTCPYCLMAKSYMNQKGIAYTEYDIDKTPTYQSAFKQLGGRGVPLILVGAYRMNGFSPEAFDRLTQQASAY
jgi:glutaredoxin